MNVLSPLIAAFDSASLNGERCALATIVGAEGSSYRRPGARMLVTERGVCTGNISPGCLESDVIEQAKQVIQSKVPALLEYDTSSADRELAWGLGLGCGGSVRVLVEPLPPESSYLSALRLACDEERNTDGLLLTTVYGPNSVTHKAVRLPRDDNAPNSRLESACETMPGVLIETLLPPVPLIVFGAGPDAVPLVELAQKLGWRTEVVDPQARPSISERFPMASRVTLGRPHELRGRVTITPRAMAIVMSHDYSHDTALLGILLASPARYIGVMGPMARTQRMLKELADAQPTLRLDDANLARLHAPAGLDIGAEGPDEIALSIIAELRAVLDGRRGGMLRDRLDGIHAQPEHECRARASAR